MVDPAADPGDGVQRQKYARPKQFSSDHFIHRRTAILSRTSAAVSSLNERTEPSAIKTLVPCRCSPPNCPPHPRYGDPSATKPRTVGGPAAVQAPSTCLLYTSPSPR